MPFGDPSTAPEPCPGDTARFLDILRNCLTNNVFVKLVLGKYRGDEPGLQRVTVVFLTLKGQDSLSFVYRYQTRDITRNLPVEAGLDALRRLLGSAFRSAHLFTLTESICLVYSRKGKGAWSRSPATLQDVPSRVHDREKRRMIDSGRPFLKALGVVNEGRQILPSMARKWKQINVFLGLLQRAVETSPLVSSRELHIVDFGAGKGYLTFAVHDFLRNNLGIEAQVTGVEAREDLVRLCNDVASNLGMEGLRFRQGAVDSYVPAKMDVMIALHACDIATDLAIHLGIRSGAAIIMCAPCCHKELRPQMNAPAPIEPVLRFGVHLGQEAEMVTDSLRALWLEACGYESQVFEFVSPEHTSKNKMILAVKHGVPRAPGIALSQIELLKKFYGITRHTLESLLRADEASAFRGQPV